jgi:hypothetical protein
VEEDMDEDLIRIVATAAAGLLVRAMGTATWRAVRDRWSGVLGRGGDGEAAVAERLEESADLLTAAEPAERERLTSEVEAEWRGELRAQLRSDPDLVEAVHSLLDRPPAAAFSTSPSVSQAATVVSGTNIQSGRDTTTGLVPRPPA